MEGTAGVSDMNLALCFHLVLEQLFFFFGVFSGNKFLTSGFSHKYNCGCTSAEWGRTTCQTLWVLLDSKLIIGDLGLNKNLRGRAFV
jgi:hypothetical protein